MNQRRDESSIEQSLFRLAGSPFPAADHGSLLILNCDDEFSEQQVDQLILKFETLPHDEL